MRFIWKPVTDTLSILKTSKEFRQIFIIFLKSKLNFRFESRFHATKKSTLDESTLWRLNIKLEKDGFKNAAAAIRIRFIEDRGYEPPQGRIFVEDDYNGFVNCNAKGYSGAWTLSEDKNDRKDGLWIWGLFEEPKYPYLYFYLGI